MTDRWSFPIALTLQRHTGCRTVKPKIAREIAPATVPEEAPSREEGELPPRAVEPSCKERA